jgi:hypothetical protein
MKPVVRALLCATIIAAACAPSALAASVTVPLRIEGSSSTLYEGTVTTDAKTFHFTGDTAQHPCDGSSTPTRGAALVTAIDALDTPLDVRGTWGSFGPTFSTINGQSVAYTDNGTPSDFNDDRYLVEYAGWSFASLGACSDPAVNGAQALFAYGTGNETLLQLVGPSTVPLGQSFNVNVYVGGTTTGVDSAIVGGQSTVAGVATIPAYSTRGVHTLKAEKTGAYIRSNRISVCVTDGADGYCGTSIPSSGGSATTTTTTTPTPAPAPAAESGAASETPVGPAPPAPAPDRTAPKLEIEGIRSNVTLSRSKAPRVLGGTVSDAGGVRQVKLRIVRRDGKRCSYFSGSKERFVRISCKEDGFWFGIGDDPEWSYLLPSRLPAGSYTLEAKAVDVAGNASKADEVHFRVR